jgi:pimeloyl-ACP methyl ester carboxylesterase
MKPSESEYIAVRGLQYHIRHWGAADSPTLLMLHGWMDVSASFQFVVDSLKRDWHVIAPDWRGFGLTQRPQADCYWFPDYIADLDAIVRHYSPDAPVNLLGHSMGGNIATVYAGIRPEKISKLINLEGFGLPASHPKQAPKRYQKWLDELIVPPQMRGYASVQEVAQRLQKTNPRLSDDKAAFLAQHWSAQNAEGQWQILGDPAHKMTNPMLYRIDEVLACWDKITAPVLWVEADDTDIWRWMGEKTEARKEIDQRIAHLAKVETRMIYDAGHMLHHDQPAVLAEMIETFLA